MSAEHPKVFEEIHNNEELYWHNSIQDVKIKFPVNQIS